MTRNFFGAFLVAFAIAFILTATREANSGPPQQPAQPYQAPAVQSVVPYNGAVYNGPPGLTPEQGKKILATMESIDAKLDNLEVIVEKLNRLNSGASAKAAAAPKITWQSVVTAKCASCHSDKNRKGDFILVAEDGKTPKPLNSREWLKVQESVNSEHMPPPPKKLSAGEKAAFQKK